MPSRKLECSLEYNHWLVQVFDHPVSEPAWYFVESNPKPKIPVVVSTRFITQLLLNCGEDLKPYSNTQVDRGLNYLFNGSCSELAWEIRRGGFSMLDKVDLLRALSTLYADCFAPRCAPVLSHLDESKGNRLNQICYMLWDVTPLLHWGSPRKRKLAYDALFEVFEGALRSTNDACVESALHGLGHLHLDLPKRSADTIKKFLKEAKGRRPEILTYAKNAMSGMVV